MTLRGDPGSRQHRRVFLPYVRFRFATTMVLSDQPGGWSDADKKLDRRGCLDVCVDHVGRV
jgi:hypothetical protein